MESLNELKFTLLGKKTNPPMIKILPPTDKSTIEHVKVFVFKCIFREQLIRMISISNNLFRFGGEIDEESC